MTPRRRRSGSRPPPAEVLSGEASPRRRERRVRSDLDELRALREEAARRRARAEGRPVPEPRAREDDDDEGEPVARVHAVAPEIHEVDLDEDGRLDQDAAKVVRRLTRHGYEAYLVGGCVRDLLLGRSPKDFDVATSARPDDVRQLFKNSRIIGRRFRLVHVLFGGGKVIETATFRRAPHQEDERSGEDLLIRNDNVFGDAPEDALRRDFRINGLFYDVEHRQVLDWVSGMQDITERTMRTIGDPVTRFQEDPVRILRAIKFAARLDLGMTSEVYDAIVHCRGTLAMAAKPRLFEEVLRLLRGGAAHRSIWLCWETGVLDVLLPELSAFLSDTEETSGSVWRVLSAIDASTAKRGAPFDDIVLWGALLLEPMREACAGSRDRLQAAHEFLEPVIDRLNMPRRVADAVRRIAAVLPRLESGRVGRFQRTPLYPLAEQVLEFGRATLDAESTPLEASPALADPKGTRKRRRRRGKKANPEPDT